MNSITERGVSQDLFIPPVGDSFSSSSEAIRLLDFRQGVLLFDQVNQIQAFLRDSQGVLVQAQCVHPFTNLFFTSKEQFDAFQGSLPATCSVRVANLEHGCFKVYLFSKRKGGELTEKEEVELEKAHQLCQMGIDCEAEGKLDDALKYYQSSLAAFQSVDPNCLEVANVYWNIGKVYDAQRKLDETIVHYEESLKIRVKSDPHSKATAEFYRELSERYWHQSNFDKALEYLDKSLTIYESLVPDSQSVAKLYLFIRQMLRSQRKRNVAIPQDVAIPHYEKALKIFLKSDTNSSDLASLQLKIGAAYHREDQLDEALGHYKSSLEVLEVAEQLDSLIGAQVYRLIGEVYQLQSKLGMALENFDKSVEIFKKKVPRCFDLAYIYHKIGFIYANLRRHEDALFYYHAGLAICEGQKSGAYKRLKEVLHDNIGSTYLSQGNSRDAINHFDKKLALNSKSNFKSLEKVINCHLALGDECAQVGEYVGALRYFFKSLELCESNDQYPEVAASSCDKIGRMYLIHGKFSEAVSYSQKSLTIRLLIASGSPEEALSNMNIGVLFSEMDKYAEALPFLKTAYSIWERKGFLQHPALLYIGNRVAEIALKFDDYVTAHVYIDKVILNDPVYKYAYNTKGLILNKQGRLEEARHSFIQALACDSGYAEASFHLLEVFVELEKKSPGSQGIEAAFTRAKQLMTQTDYDWEKRRQLKMIAEASHLNCFVQLPYPCFFGGFLYLEKIEELEKVMEAHRRDRYMAQEGQQRDRLRGRILNVENGLTPLPTFSNELEQKESPLSQIGPSVHRPQARRVRADIEMLDLRAEQHSLPSLAVPGGEIEVNGLPASQAILPPEAELRLNSDLLECGLFNVANFFEQEQNKIVLRRAHLPPLTREYFELNVEASRLATLRDQYLRLENGFMIRIKGYFDAFISELQAAYLAAQVIVAEKNKVIVEGEVDNFVSVNFDKAATYAGKMIEYMPIIGRAASILVPSRANDVYSELAIPKRSDFLKIRFLSASFSDFDQIAMHIALECTRKNEDMLSQLNSRDIDDSKVEHAGKNGAEIRLIADFLESKTTAANPAEKELANTNIDKAKLLAKAKLLGRLDAYQVIAHLAKGTVADDYAMLEGTAQRSRHEVIGKQIAKVVKEATRYSLKPCTIL